jgi:glycosyltransferase involved in cell wall biosynthesis
MEQLGPPELSVIVPAYNEAQRLPSAIDLLTGYLDARPIRAEVLIVENGSVDRTPEIADTAACRDRRFRVLHVSERGKGLAVRTGMLASVGQVAIFCDVDFSMPVGEISSLYEAVTAGADIAIASRELKNSRRVGEPSHRHLMGRVFNWLVRVLAVRGLSDTQCGFKAFRHDVAHDLFARSVVDGWAFDVEVLFLAQRRGYVVDEVPITWYYDPSSRVQPFRDTMAMLRELVQIRRNALSGRYS